MQIEDSYFDFDETLIYTGHIKPNVVKGVVVLVHGLGEHSGRYHKNVIPALLNSGLAVVFYDNFGHGKTAGKRGHCPSYNSLMELLGTVISNTESLFPKKPIFLYGHSMGGNLVLNFVLRNNTKIKGVIASSPYLRLAFEPPKWKMVIGKAMLGIWPSITLPSGLESQGISRIPEEVEKYNADPLIHDKVSPMFSFPVIDAGEWAISNASKLQVNTLLLHGTGDMIIDYKGTEEYHENSNKTTLQLFENGFHELHNDLCRDEMLHSVKNWLQQQL